MFRFLIFACFYIANNKSRRKIGGIFSCISTETAGAEAHIRPQKM